MDALDRIRLEEGEKYLNSEFRNAEEVIVLGEVFFNNGEYEQAEEYFHLAFMKLDLLEINLEADRTRRNQKALRRAEAERIANERIKAHEEELRVAEQKKLLEASTAAQEATAIIVSEKPKYIKERAQISSYTVSRGETLPLIAAHPEVYGDRNLWPLIYRANRDQISDPRHIWPGQVLRIKRNQSREEIFEARRYAQEKPFR